MGVMIPTKVRDTIPTGLHHHLRLTTTKVVTTILRDLSMMLTPLTPRANTLHLQPHSLRIHNMAPTAMITTSIKMEGTRYLHHHHPLHRFSMIVMTMEQIVG
ncbi:hypothetical protein HK096_009233, partial [Nowakowskiella sp. JEL0078]